MTEGTKDDPWARPAANLRVGLLDEVGEHLLAGIEVGNDTVANRPDRTQSVRRPAKHSTRVLADRFYRAGRRVEGDEGRLTDDNPLALREDAGIGGTEVDGQIAAESCERHDDWGT